MKFKRMLVTAVLIVTIAMIWSLQAGAYVIFAEDGGGCGQCHTASAIHDVAFHDALDCSACHAQDPVAISSCVVCHDAGDVLTLPAHQGELPNGQWCGICHDTIPTDSRSWSELKNIFE
jgi:hypothetical protein